PKLVFDRDRNAGELRIAPSIEIAIDSLRARDRPIRDDGVERVERGIQGRHAGERVAADVGGRARARSHRLANVGDHLWAVHQMTRGTLKNPASTAGSGAAAIAVSRSSDGRTSSSRSAAWRVTTVAVGGTPVVSICWTSAAYARMSPSWRAKRSSRSEERRVGRE